MPPQAVIRQKSATLAAAAAAAVAARAAAPFNPPKPPALPAAALAPSARIQSGGKLSPRSSFQKAGSAGAPELFLQLSPKDLDRTRLRSSGSLEQLLLSDSPRSAEGEPSPHTPATIIETVASPRSDRMADFSEQQKWAEKRSSYRRDSGASSGEESSAGKGAQKRHALPEQLKLSTSDLDRSRLRGNSLGQLLRNDSSQSGEPSPVQAPVAGHTVHAFEEANLSI